MLVVSDDVSVNAPYSCLWSGPVSIASSRADDVLLAPDVDAADVDTTGSNPAILSPDVCLVEAVAVDNTAASVF